MDPFATTIGFCIAGLLVAIASYFGWRQIHLLRTLPSPELLTPQRMSYLRSQAHRRLFGSALLLILAGLMIGLMFLEFDPEKLKAEHGDANGKQAMQFLSYYLITMLLVLMVLLALAVLDFWATARFSLVQQKQLARQHLAGLEADLLERRDRQTGLE